jgi:hypothetical protein
MFSLIFGPATPIGVPDQFLLVFRGGVACQLGQSSRGIGRSTRKWLQHRYLGPQRVDRDDVPRIWESVLSFLGLV